MEDFIVGGLVFSSFLGVIATIGQLLCMVFSSTPQNNTAIVKKDIITPQIKKTDVECFPFNCINNNGIISYYFSKEKADRHSFPQSKEGFRTSNLPICYCLSSFASNGLYKNYDFIEKGEKIIKIYKNITPNKTYVFDVSSLPIIADVSGFIKYHNNYKEIKPLEDGELCFTIDTNITPTDFYDFPFCDIENNEENNTFKITLPLNIGYGIEHSIFKLNACKINESGEYKISLIKGHQTLCIYLNNPNSTNIDNVVLYKEINDETNEIKGYYISGNYVLHKENDTITSNKKQLLYIMHDIANNAYKIGISKRPKDRERTLQSDKPSIGLFKVYIPKENETAYGIEQYLHRKYAHKQWKREDKKISEWFALTENDIKELLSLYDWKNIDEI